MKTGTIPTNEKECKKFLHELTQYAAKRGIKIFSIVAYSTMCEACITLMPDLKTMDPSDIKKYGLGFLGEYDSFEKFIMSDLEDFKNAE